LTKTKEKQDVAGKLYNKGDALWRRDGDSGWRVGWRHRYEFEKGHFDDEMTYGEAKRKAADLQSGDNEKFYFPELIYTEESPG
jgi:hypothetical protein